MEAFLTIRYMLDTCACQSVAGIVVSTRCATHCVHYQLLCWWVMEDIVFASSTIRYMSDTLHVNRYRCAASLSTAQRLRQQSQRSAPRVDHRQPTSADLHLSRTRRCYDSIRAAARVNHRSEARNIMRALLFEITSTNILSLTAVVLNRVRLTQLLLPFHPSTHHHTSPQYPRPFHRLPEQTIAPSTTLTYILLAHKLGARQG
jgi:hypothetical protein